MSSRSLSLTLSWVIGLFMKKIVHVLLGKANPKYTINGVNVVVDKYANLLHRDGHEVVVESPQKITIARNNLSDKLVRRRLLKAIWLKMPARPAIYWMYMCFVRLVLLDGKEGVLYTSMKVGYERMIVQYVKYFRYTESRSK